MEDHYDCWYHGIDCLMGWGHVFCIIRKPKKIKKKLAGVSRGRMKVWKRGEILKVDLALSYQPRFTSYLASAPGQTKLSSNGSRFQLSRSLRYQFASGETALGWVWAKNISWVSQCSKYPLGLFSKCLCFPKWKSKNVSKKVPNIYECYLEMFSIKS